MSLGSENRKDVNIICENCHKKHHLGTEVFPIDKIANLSEEENISEILFSELQEWRLKKSRETKKPAYIILHDKTLKEISIKKPSTKDELLDIKGIKEYKANWLGEEIFSIIRNYKTEFKEK